MNTGSVQFSKIVAQRTPNTNEDRHKEEVATLLALFHKFVTSTTIRSGEWESLEELMKARANIAIKRAFDGLGLTYNEAILLIRKADNLSIEQKSQQKIILAAIDNLVDFSVCEEYQMAQEMSFLENAIEEQEEMEEEEWLDYFLPLFNKFNDRFMRVENLDIEYAAAIAASLNAIKDDTILMYMTMGDERVRPWHLQHEGFTAAKSQFPDWLIPPIEHQCRCYLVEDSSSVIGSIQASSIPEMPDWFNKTFKESLAKGGRIFSDEHPYFKVDELHINRLNDIAQRIKRKYLDNETGW